MSPGGPAARSNQDPGSPQASLCALGKTVPALSVGRLSCLQFFYLMAVTEPSAQGPESCHPLGEANSDPSGRRSGRHRMGLGQ